MLEEIDHNIERFVTELDRLNSEAQVNEDKDKV
jgi:hypothetical protein